MTDVLKKLLDEINKNIKLLCNINFECLIINDASTNHPPEMNKNQVILSH